MSLFLNFSPNTYAKHPFGVLENGTYHEILNTERDVWGGTITSLTKVKAKKDECNQ